MTDEILRQVDEQLFARAATKSVKSPPAASTHWWSSTVTSLWKLFLGPPGTVTRLHVDACDAHGWLAQVGGTKVFVLFPPSDGPALAPIEGETETVQSDVDPAACAAGLVPWPAGVTPHVAVVRPGEAIVIPRVWWHWAAALDASVTVQSNFYDASNAGALATMVVTKLKDVTRQNKTGGGHAHQ